MDITFECISEECLCYPFLDIGYDFEIENYILGDLVTCPHCGKTYGTDYNYGWGFADFWLVSLDNEEVLL